MAIIKKTQIRPEDGNDYETILYPETSTDMVIDEATGKTVATHLAERATPTKLGHVKADTDAEGKLIIEKPYVIGTYTGNDATSRTISLGFRPKAVLVMARGSAVYNYNGNVNGGLVIDGSDSYNGGNNHDAVALTIVSNGFRVYHNPSKEVYTNTSSYLQNGGVYHYMAFR